MRALVFALVIVGCGWSGAKEKQRRPKYDPPEDRPVKQPVDPIEALLPTDDDSITWLVPGRIQLEAGGAPIESPGGNRPIEVKLIDEQGGMARLAIQLAHVRFSVWSDRARVMTILGVERSLVSFAGGGSPTETTMRLNRGARVRRLARKGDWTQVRYIGALSADGWVRENELVKSWPRRELRARQRHASPGFKTVMASPGTVIRAEPKWTGRQIAVVANIHHLNVLRERDGGWVEIGYTDGEVRVHGFVSWRDPPSRAHRFTDPETPLARITPNATLASGTCLHASPDGESIGYLVGDRPVELLPGGKHGWWSVAVDSPWGPIAFAARGPDGQSLERCAPDGSVPTPGTPGPPGPPVPPPSVP